ncbi:toxic anion resistance protein [Acidisoma cellulosilytica]|uniref:Toxic anion resistance protein n=1 Tax=Acidisoma cellulosilyticum TaxID=2802395 RepID=A0A963Z4F8_9PROT|nr:toxic anion resistance protein [Acidisoma cellulosilyticum]MCB8882281.1 toxic anion resistance protein [Acidisoma cellulosilyticum]
MTGTIDVKPLFDDTPLSVTAKAGIPTDADISALGARSRNIYDGATKRILQAHKTVDLGTMGVKLNGLIAVAKGMDIKNGGRQSLFEKATGFFRNERERIIAHVANVQQRLDALMKEVEDMVAAERDHIKTLTDLQLANLDYHQDMKEAAATAEAWLAAAQAALAAPPDPADEMAAARRAALQQLTARLERTINDFRNAMTLAKQEALTITQEQGNAQILIDEFERAQTIVLPALRSIVGQELIQIDQKHAAETDAMLRSTLDDALRIQAQMTGDNAVRLSQLQQSSAINTATLIDCETILEQAALRVKAIQEEGRKARLQDATNRSEVERRLLARLGEG